MATDPRAALRAWLPHVLILGAFVAAVWLLSTVIAAMFEPILLAAALAILTAPVLLEPIRNQLARRFPRLKEQLRARIAGVAATILLVIVAFTPLLLVVVSQASNLNDLADKVKGIVTRDKETIIQVAEAVEGQVEEINRHYESLQLPTEEISGWVRDFLSESSDVNSAFISFIFAGTGTLAQVLLALISLTYFYVDGPRLVRGLLAYSPLTEHQQERLLGQHRGVVLRLLNDTVATALVKGVVLGTIVYAVDGVLGSGSLPFLPVAIVAALITLLPLVGVTMVWLPFAGLAWAQGNIAGAVALAVLCWGSNFALDHYRDRISRQWQQSTDWHGFLLFLGVVGGLISHGPKGLIIGPFAVVMVISIGRAWLPLYVASRAGLDDESGEFPALDLPVDTDAADVAAAESDGTETPDSGPTPAMT